MSIRVRFDAKFEDEDLAADVYFALSGIEKLITGRSGVYGELVEHDRQLEHCEGCDADLVKDHYCQGI